MLTRTSLPDQQFPTSMQLVVRANSATTVPHAHSSHPIPRLPATRTFLQLRVNNSKFVKKHTLTSLLSVTPHKWRPHDVFEMTPDFIFSYWISTKIQRPPPRGLETQELVPCKVLWSLIVFQDLKRAMSYHIHMRVTLAKKVMLITRPVGPILKSYASPLEGLGFFILCVFFERTFLLRVPASLSSPFVSVVSTKLSTVADNPCCKMSSIS